MISKLYIYIYLFMFIMRFAHSMILEEETQSWRVESLLGKYVGLVTKESEDAEVYKYAVSN